MATTPGILDLQLLLVRSLLDRASLAVNTGDDTSLMTAMLLADVAGETLTKLSCADKGVKVDKNDGIVTLLGPLAAACPTLQGRPEIAAVKKLRDARNSVQHSGLVPSAQATSLFLRDAEAFAALVVCEVFKRDYHQISVRSLVADEELRFLLDRAALHRAQGRPRAGLVYGCAAFELLLLRWARGILDSRGFFQSNEARLERMAAGIVLRVLSRVSQASTVSLQCLEEEGYQYIELARMTMGFSIDELVRLQRLSLLAAGLPWEPMPEELRPPSKPDERVDRESPTVENPDVDFVIEVVARQGWRLAALHPGVLSS